MLRHRFPDELHRSRLAGVAVRRGEKRKFRTCLDAFAREKFLDLIEFHIHYVHDMFSTDAVLIVLFRVDVQRCTVRGNDKLDTGIAANVFYSEIWIVSSGLLDEPLDLWQLVQASALT